MLTITSLLSILFLRFTWRTTSSAGIEPGGMLKPGGVFIFVVWLYGTLVLAERRSGFIILFVGRSFRLVVPVVHMRGGNGRRQARQFQRRLLLRLDADRDRRDRDLLGHPLGEAVVERTKKASVKGVTVRRSAGLT